MPFMGGNSVKATSGINGALTKTQMKAGILDSAEIFEADTIKSAAGLGGTEAPTYTAPLAHVLTHESGPAVDWLVDRFGLDLSLVSRLGGHSQPRTHRGSAKFPGFTITCVARPAAAAAPLHASDGGAHALSSRCTRTRRA
jgi:succinate dehydrogenase/fumarate reductase flavoprotein subunit